MKCWHVDIKHCNCFETYRIECHPTTMSRFNLFKNWEAFVVGHIIHVSKTGPKKNSWKFWVLVDKHLEKAERKVNPGRRMRMLLWMGLLVMGWVWTFPPPIYHLWGKHIPTAQSSQVESVNLGSLGLGGGYCTQYSYSTGGGGFDGSRHESSQPTYMTVLTVDTKLYWDTDLNQYDFIGQCQWHAAKLIDAEASLRKVVWIQRRRRNSGGRHKSVWMTQPPQIEYMHISENSRTGHDVMEKEDAERNSERTKNIVVWFSLLHLFCMPRAKPTQVCI